MSTITLYRGDSTKIDEFAFSKTDKRCLVGQGIYLSNNREIAQSYRSKGGHAWRRRVSGFDGSLVVYLGTYSDLPDAPVTREIAYKKAYPAFQNAKLEEYRFRHGWNWMEVNKKAKEKAFEAAIQRAYNEGIAENYIRATYSYVSGRKSILVQYYRTHEIVSMNEYTGYISSFEFDNMELDANVIVNDTFQRTIYGTNYPIIRDIFCEALDRTASNLVMGDARNLASALGIPYSRIRQILMPYGIKGIEYYGGMVTGGKRHRAFCIWDEDYVNQHKVNRTR